MIFPNIHFWYGSTTNAIYLISKRYLNVVFFVYSSKFKTKTKPDRYFKKIHWYIAWCLFNSLILSLSCTYFVRFNQIGIFLQFKKTFLCDNRQTLRFSNNRILIGNYDFFAYLKNDYKHLFLCTIFRNKLVFWAVVVRKVLWLATKKSWFILELEFVCLYFLEGRKMSEGFETQCFPRWNS